jgi:hypothetical protein
MREARHDPHTNWEIRLRGHTIKRLEATSMKIGSDMNDVFFNT